jgi:hypothetical protein
MAAGVCVSQGSPGSPFCCEGWTIVTLGPDRRNCRTSVPHWAGRFGLPRRVVAAVEGYRPWDAPPSVEHRRGQRRAGWCGGCGQGLL